MGPWRLELVRAWRTRRAFALAATFMILGLGGPVLVYYLPRLVKHGGQGIEITIPPPTAADGITNFAQNAGQLGTLVVVVVAAASLAIDTRPGLAIFYRTRLRQPARLVLPRYLTVTATAVGALALGTLGAWYETSVLLGHLSPARLAAGFGLQTLWLCFATAITVLLTSVVRSVLATVGWSLGCLLGLAALGAVPVLSTWLPTRLASGLAAFTGPAPARLWHPVLVAALASLALVTAAVRRLGSHEPTE
jgi:ABC-2 type transport system permease protein